MITISLPGTIYVISMECYKHIRRSLVNMRGGVLRAKVNMSTGVYSERTVRLSQEEAFEAVKQAVPNRYPCRVINEDPPRLLVIEQIPSPWKSKLHEVAKHIVFYFYSTDQNTTRIAAISLIHHELMKRIFYGYMGIGAFILFSYFAIISAIADHVKHLPDNLLTILLLIFHSMASVLLIVFGALHYEIYKRKDEIARSILTSLERSKE